MSDSVQEGSAEYKDADDVWSLYEDCKTAALARVFGGQKYTATAESTSATPSQSSSTDGKPPEERAPVKMRISLTGASSSGDKQRDASGSSGAHASIITDISTVAEKEDDEGNFCRILSFCHCRYGN